MTIVVISAVWCHACLSMRKSIKALKEKHPEWTWIEYDLDLDDEQVAPFHIGKIIPVFVVMKDSIEIKRIVGEHSLAALESELLNA
jgi:thiol-disulfide isomerase/thioredoxin